MFPGQPINLDGIAQRPCHRLVDKEGLARLEHRPGLFQMRAAIDALDQDGIDLPAEVLDGIDDLDPEFFLQLFRVTIDSRPARFDILAAALERGHHFPARHVVFVLRIIQQFGKGGHVGSIQSYHPQAKLGAKDWDGEGHAHSQQRKHSWIHISGCSARIVMGRKPNPA